MARTEDDGLGGFLPAVSAWFRETFGTPTPAQVQGWPVIASGRNALIFAPTGSGKTLAAFLTALDQLWHLPIEQCQQQGTDVGAIDVRIGHDNDAVITQFVGVEFVWSDTRA